MQRSPGNGASDNFLLQVEHIAALLEASGARILVALGPHPVLDIWQKALQLRERVPGLTLIRVAPPHGAGRQSCNRSASHVCRAIAESSRQGPSPSLNALRGSPGLMFRLVMSERDWCAWRRRTRAPPMARPGFRSDPAISDPDPEDQIK